MRGAVGQTATDPGASFAGDSELARVMARTLDCPHLQEGCTTPAAPNARNTHQPLTCLWAKSVRQHEMLRCEGRVGPPHDVLDSCAQPTQDSCYCSDVSGAFDRVRAEKLLEKLRCKGVHPAFVDLAGSWLQQRSAQVVVEGQRSDKMLCRSMVFQGTVLGPTLWNLFYEDARRAIHEAGFVEIVYADDLNALREFEHNASVDSVMSEDKKCQTELHKWFQANQVSFDPEGIRPNRAPHIATHLNCSVSHSTVSSGWTCACARR